ncbi:MAG: ABC transporter related protein, partial [Parcubacteria group bacterium GW2011_GWB2_40_8]
MYKKGLKIIWKYLKEYRRDLIILSILGVFSATANGIIPFISGRLFDAILNDNIILFELFREISIPTWLFFIILWALIQLIGSVIDWRIGIKSQLVSHAAYVDYLSDGYGKLLNLPMSFFKNEKIGDLSDKMNKAASLLSTIIGNIIIYLAPQFLSIFVALGVSFSINYLLSFIILAGLAAYVVIMFKYVRPTVELYKEGHVAYGKAFGTIFEAMGNVGAIKQSVAEDYERKRIRFYLKNKVTSIWANIYKNWEKLSFYQRLIIVLTQLAIFLISVSLVRNDTITIGELVMFNGYASMVFGPFVVLGRNWQFLQNGIVAMERAERVLQTTAETYEPEKSFHLDEIKGDIEFKDVSFSYKNGKPVLENINLKIKQGEVVALVGESGVGKSTLIDLISAYHFPNKGKVLIDDHDIRRIKLKFLRQNIAVVPQETVL